MKLRHIAVMAMVLIALLAWIGGREMNDDAQTSERELRALDAFAIAESELHRDVLSARAGMLRNYDPLVREDRALHAALENIPDNRRLTALLDRESELVEKFKSRNALLQNSLAYFELFSTTLVARQGPFTQAVSELTGAMLQLTLDTSPAVVAQVDAHLVEVSSSTPPVRDAAVTEGLLAHGHMLRELLPATDELLNSLFAVPSGAEQALIRERVMERQQANEMHARRARYTLIATSLLLLALLAHLGMRLNSRALILRRQATLEHIIAEISTRFINSRAHETESLIERALAELAAFIQADRAYLLVEKSQVCLYQWCRASTSFPPGWPEGAIALMREVSVDERGVIEVHDARAAPSGILKTALTAAGLITWLGVPSRCGEPLAGLLGFDCITTRSIMRSRDLGLLRMALNAMSNAIERRDLERDRVRLEANLQHARRMETIGALTSGIAHNFNNIVGAILGFTESAQLQFPPDTRVGGSLGEIRRAGERARDLVDQILTFGRRRAARRARLSVHEWIDEARSLLEATLPPHVRLVVRETVPGLTIWGELTSLQQVILNVCNNAAQAMDSPGTIEIEMDLRQLTPGAHAEPAELAPGTYVVICLSDPGRGMDEATLERVFEPFFTTRSEGNGLGLAMVREIVSEHGGTVRILSTLGSGTRVDIWLPGFSAAQSPQTGAHGLSDRGGGETVLVLEANRERLLRHEEILAALGYEPVGFTQAAEAEAAWLADPTRFDAALYCAHLRDGPTVLAQAASLRNKAPHLAILLASASPGDFAAPELAEAGVSEIIRQPLNSAEVAGALVRCLSFPAAAFHSLRLLLPS